MTKLRAVFLDFYGTLVHEDDINLAEISALIHANADSVCSKSDVSRFWHDAFFRRSALAFGTRFVRQRELGILSLCDTLTAFQAPLDAEKIIQPQFAHWIAPPIFGDSFGFLDFLRDLGLPVIAVSNVDRNDVEAAIQIHGMAFDGLITSDDARAYKPRPEMFHMALDLVSVEPAEVLHIGDSFGSDVRGAQPLGIPVAWVNRTGRISPGYPGPEFDVADLNELQDIIRDLI